MHPLTHIDENGRAVMVDISDKVETDRSARASGKIRMSKEALFRITDGDVPKGDVFGIARIAGIMAAKRTSELIPLCHPLPLTKIGIEFEILKDEGAVYCECLVKLSGKTGAEMEALCGVSTALLTIYDMCKAIDRTMVLSEICLEEKDGGKSGHFQRETVGSDPRAQSLKEEKEITIL